jgi:hypothetical protein
MLRIRHKTRDNLNGWPPLQRPAGPAAGRRLRDLGYDEGRNEALESRWADGHVDRLADLAAELVALKVDEEYG